MIQRLDPKYLPGTILFQQRWPTHVEAIYRLLRGVIYLCFGPIGSDQHVESVEAFVFKGSIQ